MRNVQFRIPLYLQYSVPASPSDRSTPETLWYRSFSLYRFRVLKRTPHQVRVRTPETLWYRSLSLYRFRVLQRTPHQVRVRTPETLWYRSFSLYRFRILQRTPHQVRVRIPETLWNRSLSLYRLSSWECSTKRLLPCFKVFKMLSEIAFSARKAV